MEYIVDYKIYYIILIFLPGFRIQKKRPTDSMERFDYTLATRLSP